MSAHTAGWAFFIGIFLYVFVFIPLRSKRHESREHAKTIRTMTCPHCQAQEVEKVTGQKVAFIRGGSGIGRISQTFSCHHCGFHW